MNILDAGPWTYPPAARTFALWALREPESQGDWGCIRVMQHLDPVWDGICDSYDKSDVFRMVLDGYQDEGAWALRMIGHGGPEWVNLCRSSIVGHGSGRSGARNIPYRLDTRSPRIEAELGTHIYSWTIDQVVAALGERLFPPAVQQLSLL